MPNPARPAPNGRPLRGLTLPIVTAGLAALLPLQATTLLGRFGADPSAPSRPPFAPALAVAPTLAIAPPARPLIASLLPGRTGVQASEVLVPTLAAPLPATGRPSPLGEDRPADGRLLAEVARRQAELDRREHELETRAAQIEAAAQLARQQIAELTRMRAEIEKLVVRESAAASADLDSLVGLYSNMKPPQAAAVLAKLDPPKAAAILQKLDTRAAGPILAAMDPAAALAITEEVAQRRAAFRR